MSSEGKRGQKRNRKKREAGKEEDEGWGRCTTAKKFSWKRLITDASLTTFRFFKFHIVSVQWTIPSRLTYSDWTPIHPRHRWSFLSDLVIWRHIRLSSIDYFSSKPVGTEHDCRQRTDPMRSNWSRSTDNNFQPSARCDLIWLVRSITLELCDRSDLIGSVCGRLYSLYNI